MNKQDKTAFIAFWVVCLIIILVGGYMLAPYYDIGALIGG